MSLSVSERYDESKIVVTEMLKSLSELNDSPHYSLAYLESMVVSWATTNDIVLEEVKRTVKWLKEEGAKNASL
jgi:hypothetical protein